jgi:hypothetical protein
MKQKEHSKNKLKIVSLFVLPTVLFFIMTANFVCAAQGYSYTPMEKIPGFETAGTDFPNYILSITKFAIWVVGIAALLMIIIGGFMYITSAGNTSRTETAKTIIFDSLYGLLVALAAWLLLYVINPDLVRVNISLKPMSVAPAAAPAVPPPTVPAAGTYSNTEAVAKLQAAGINVISSGNCSDRNNSSCTSLDGIPQSTIDNLINLKNGSGCSFSVTGGTEVGHASHGSGRSVVDVTETSCLTDALSAQNRSRYNITKICATSSYSNLSYNCSNYSESAPHFHLVFAT